MTHSSQYPVCRLTYNLLSQPNFLIGLNIDLPFKQFHIIKGFDPQKDAIHYKKTTAEKEWAGYGLTIIQAIKN